MQVLKFKKKPVEIEAMQFTDESKDCVRNWVRCNTAANFSPNGDPELHIQTLEGVMVASLGDWVIKGIKGEYYPCKPDIFSATYEPIEA